ncbi:MAG TPA: methionyl-tRNA formyltransferase [Clostridia bacterium]|nr:methionyl-tRNA formyltransferase [Clostridia bacterium]
MRIAFLGTPEFALPSLQMLVDAGHEVALFTQPDRPKGRHGELTPPPTKVLAVNCGLPVYQFEKIRLPEGVAALRAFAPDLMVTAAFGQILSKENLDIPRYGCINVHGSLLPKYRGAAPVQWAVINGETVTGVTTMLTDVGLDTGDMLLKRAVEIGSEETGGELMERLSIVGAELLKETIEKLQAGTLEREKQNEAEATKCPMLKKEHGKVDFTRSAKEVHDLVRGVTPWPGAYAFLEDETVKLHKTRLTGSKASDTAGTCVAENERLFVNAADERIEILELQFAGGKRMAAEAALRGRSLTGKAFQ